MNNLFRIILVGPTGAGKSQFCNFIHNDLTNSIYKVSNSLNSCTTVPQSTIIERQNIKLELIDSPGSSDSNNNDKENLKALAQYLKSKNKINQILLVLSFENRLSKDTRDYLTSLNYFFPSNQFISHLMVVFTHYPLDPDEDDIKKSNLYKKELNELLNKIFMIPLNSIENNIPIYFINTKIINKSQNPHFDKNSIKILDSLIAKLKSRMISSSSFTIKDSINFDSIIKNNKLVNEINKNTNLKRECTKLKDAIQLIPLKSQAKSIKHNHGVVLLYSNNDWTCNICKQFYQKSISKYFCSFCDFNLCKKCNENNTKYSLSSYNSQSQVKFQKYQFPSHEHILIFCRSSRFSFGLNNWICDLCKTGYNNYNWSFYCTLCDYDMCTMCAKKYIF